MKVQLVVEVDGTYDQCEEVLEQLEDHVTEGTMLELGAGVMAYAVSVQELPAVGRAKKEGSSG